MKLTKIIAASVLAFLILLSGCQINDTSWAFEFEGERMPAGVYIMFMNQALFSAYDILHQEWLDWTPAYPGQAEPMHIMDMRPRDIMNASIEGMRLYDWVLREAQVLARRHFAVQAKLAQRGIEPDPAEMMSAAAAAAADFRANGDNFREIGVSESSLAIAYQSSVALTTLFDALYGEGGNYEVTEQQIRDYFRENFIRGQELVFFKAQLHPWAFEAEENMIEDQARVDAENADMMEMALSFQDRLRAGEDIALLQFELAMFHSPMGGEIPLPDDSDFVVRTDNERALHPTVREGVLSLSNGQVGLFEDDDIIAVVRRMDVLENPQHLAMHREQIRVSMRYDDYFLPLLDYTAWNLPIVVNDASMRRYSPSSLMQA